MNKTNKLIFIDTSYNLSQLIERDSLNVIYSRDLNGYFKNVWSVNPLSSLTNKTSQNKIYQDKFMITKLTDKHVFIEGSISSYSFLKYFKIFNFLLSQITLFIYLYKLIKKEKISLIKSGDILYCGLYSFILSKITKIPYVIRMASNNDKIREVTKRPIQKRLFYFINIEKFFEKMILKNSLLIFGANQNNLNFAIRSGGDVNKAHLIRYGNLINEHHFIQPELRVFSSGILDDFGLKKEKFILYIGRFELEKHVDDIIYVFNEITKIKNDYKLLLIGEGSQKHKLMQIAIDLNLDKKIIFTGIKNQKWLSQIIPLCKIYLSPHTGRALCEAALGGAIIICYDIDWQSEIVEHGVNGFLVPYRNLNILKEMSVKIVEGDNNFYDKFRLRIREKAMNLLDPNIIADLEAKNIDLNINTK